MSNKLRIILLLIIILGVMTMDFDAAVTSVRMVNDIDARIARMEKGL